MLRDYGAPKSWIQLGPRSRRLQHSDDREHLDKTGFDEAVGRVEYSCSVTGVRLRCLCADAGDAVELQEEGKGKQFYRV